MRKRAVIWYILPAALILSGVTLFPLIYTLYNSFHRWELYNPFAGKVFVGVSQYSRILTDPRFWHATKLTFIYSAFTVPATLVLGLLVALAVNSKTVRGKGAIRSSLIIPLVMTPVVVGFAFRLMYNGDTGIIPYLLGLIGIHVGTILGDPHIALYAVGLGEIWYQTPFVFLILTAGLQVIPRELYEAASVDGASMSQLLRYITLPNLKFAILIATLFRVISSFNSSFDLIYATTGGGPGNSSEILTVLGYITAFNNLTMGRASALAIIMLVILIGISTIMIRALVRKGA